MAKTNNDTTDLTPVLYLGTAAILYFGLIRPITNKLGITQSAADTHIENENATASTSKAKAWTYNFWRDYKSPKKTIIEPDLTNLAKIIYNAFGIFNDDENAIYGVFRSLRSLVHLSQLCDKYFQLYKTDLLSRLQNPWYKSNDGLSPEEFNVIAKIVNALPENIT